MKLKSWINLKSYLLKIYDFMVNFKLNTEIKLIGNSLSNPFLANGNTLNLESFDKINRIINELNKILSNNKKNTCMS